MKLPILVCAENQKTSLVYHTEEPISIVETENRPISRERQSMVKDGGKDLPKR